MHAAPLRFRLDLDGRTESHSLKAGIDGQKPGKSTNDETGSDEKHDSQRHLGDHQRRSDHAAVAAGVHYIDSTGEPSFMTDSV